MPRPLLCCFKHPQRWHAATHRKWALLRASKQASRHPARVSERPVCSAAACPCFVSWLRLAAIQGVRGLGVLGDCCRLPLPPLLLPLPLLAAAAVQQPGSRVCRWFPTPCSCHVVRARSSRASGAGGTDNPANQPGHSRGQAQAAGAAARSGATPRGAPACRLLSLT